MANEIFSSLPDVMTAEQLASALQISKSGAYALLNHQGYQFCYPRNQEKDQRSVGLAEGCQGGTEQTQGSRPNHAAANVFQPAQFRSLFPAGKGEQSERVQPVVPISA